MVGLEIRKFNRLNDLELVELQTLYDACVHADQIKPRMYWDIVQSRHSDDYRDFLYFRGNTVVGYLGFFLFSDDDIEICAFVHPNFRNQHVFKQLLLIAADEMGQFRPRRIIFTIPHATMAMPAKNWLQRIGAEQLHTEFRMRLDKFYHTEVFHNDIEIRSATLDDASALASLDKACFNADFETMVNRYQKILPEINRRVWVGCIDNKIIAKIHANIQPTGVTLHDFCVLPSFQGKHYGINLLQTTVYDLLEAGHNKISVDVLADNDRALRIYEYANFIVTEAWDMWAWDFKHLHMSAVTSSIH